MINSVRIVALAALLAGSMSVCANEDNVSSHAQSVSSAVSSAQEAPAIQEQKAVAPEAIVAPAKRSKKMRIVAGLLMGAAAAGAGTYVYGMPEVAAPYMAQASQMAQEALASIQSMFAGVPDTPVAPQCTLFGFPVACPQG